MTVDREGKMMKVNVEDKLRKAGSAGQQTNCRAISEIKEGAPEGGRRYRKFEFGPQRPAHDGGDR